MSRLVLCFVTRREAEHLMMAPRLAGGWVAVSPVCCTAMMTATEATELSGSGADCLALLPDSWVEAGRRPLTGDAIAAVLSALDGAGGEALEFAARVRAHLAPAVRS